MKYIYLFILLFFTLFMHGQGGQYPTPTIIKGIITNLKKDYDTNLKKNQDSIKNLESIVKSHARTIRIQARTIKIQADEIKRLQNLVDQNKFYQSKLLDLIKEQDSIIRNLMNANTELRLSEQALKFANEKLETTKKDYEEKLEGLYLKLAKTPTSWEIGSVNIEKIGKKKYNYKFTCTVNTEYISKYRDLIEKKHKKVSVTVKIIKIYNNKFKTTDFQNVDEINSKTYYYNEVDVSKKAYISLYFNISKKIPKQEVFINLLFTLKYDGKKEQLGFLEKMDCKL